MIYEVVAVKKTIYIYTYIYIIYIYIYTNDARSKTNMAERTNHREEKGREKTKTFAQDKFVSQERER